MRMLVALIVLVFGSAANLFAQQYKPDQFYSNGLQIDGWNLVTNSTDPDGDYHWTIHFSRKNPGDVFFSQSIAKRYVNPKDPDKKNRVFFFSEPQQVFTGFYDVNEGKYSVLPRHLRRATLAEIRPQSFPKPGEMPKLYEMSRKNCEPEKSDARELADPPEVPAQSGKVSFRVSEELERQASKVKVERDQQAK